MRRILEMKCTYLALILYYCIILATGDNEAEPANGINILRRVRIQGKVTQEPLMCPLVESMDRELCDTTKNTVDRSLMPEGTVCLVEEESGDVQFIECVDGAWESVSLRRGTSTETGRHKRFIGFLIFLAFSGIVLCVYFCRPRLPPAPTISCPHVPVEFFAERGHRSKIIFWNPITAHGDRTDIFRTQGPPPGSRFSEGHHRITYMVRDRHGRTNHCGFGFNMKVRRCSGIWTYYVPNGRVSCTDGSIYGSTCSYSCYYGYSLQGASTSTCELSGWTSNKPYCAAISCGQPPYVINGRIGCGSVTFGSRCSVYCVTTGYVLQGSSTIECSGNGQWTTPGACHDVTPPTIRCASQMLLHAGPLNEPVIVNWTTPSVTDNSNEPVIFTSDPVPGTIMGVGAHQVIFTAVDRRGNRATCYMSVYVQIIKCSSKQLAVDVSNVTCTYENVYGSVCSVGCSPDYYLEGEANRICLEDSTWSGEQAKCIGFPCSEPPEVANGNFTCDKGYFYQEICTLSCQNGFKPVGPLTITCGITWSPAGSCEDVQSPEFPDGCPPDMTFEALRLGELTYVTFSLPRVTDNSEQPVDIISEPSPGSAFDISTTNVTVSATDVSGNVASCSFRVKVTERSCDMPNFDPATKLLRYHCPHGHQFGATCTMSCPDGTTLSETITCDEMEGGNLTWTHAGSAPPTCLGEVCPKLPDPGNGSLSCEYTTNQKYGPGVQCRATCDPGHVMPKSARDTFVCYNQIGVWSGSAHNCIKTKKPDQVQLAYKMTYNLASCTEDEGKKILATLQRKMILSKVHAVCPEGWNCPMVSDFECIPESGEMRQAEMAYTKLEIAIIVDLGNYDDQSNQNDDIYDSILQDTQTAIIIDDDAGILDLPVVGSPEEFTPPRLIYSCQPGTVFTTSTLSCIDCGVGYTYLNSTQQCAPCPQGTYQDAVTAFSCTKCPEGKTTRVSRATSLDQCIDICPPGSSSISKTGLAPCTPCEVGTYQNSTWGKTCDLCPFGMTTGSAGSVSKDQCQFYNIRLSKHRPQAVVTLPDLRTGTATFMLWLHLPIGSPQQALTLSFNRTDDETQLASITVGHLTIFLGFETSTVVSGVRTRELPAENYSWQRRPEPSLADQTRELIQWTEDQYACSSVNAESIRSSSTRDHISKTFLTATKSFYSPVRCPMRSHYECIVPISSTSSCAHS
ncbi:hypothetical protein Btru_013442 [Bulinus truncatus]|nr:hypothetical protein Btru_013442 [Bulinus truncatus]